MTWDQYWYGDVWMVKAFREAEELRQKRKDAEAWMQGAYIYDAIGRLAPILHPFAKKGAKPIPYVEKPYLAESKKVESEQDQKQFAENERLRAALYFKNWARSAKKHFEKGS